MRLLTSCLILLAAAVLSTTQADDSSSYRLPKTITPYKYNISLDIDPEQDSVNGTVIIYFRNTNPKDTLKDLYLHADPQYVKIASVSVNNQPKCTFSTNATTTIVHVACPNAFSANKNNLTVVFSTNFTGAAHGMYKRSYTQNGTEHWFVGTQFEPERAREAIPCLDEPSFKATFNVNITVPDKYTALFNTRYTKFSYAKSNIKYQFAPTPNMSTYLLAFSVSEFGQEDLKNSTFDFGFSVVSRPDVLKFTSSALSYGPKILKALEDWTGVSLPDMGMSSSYQIAEPEKSGAMENWGLITYGESDLLDTGVNATSISQQTSILTIMSHELAHQWFGDYVTTDWWSEIWLNEGFASYFQYFLAHEIVPEFGLNETFVIDSLQSALVSDSDANTLPIVSKEEDIYTAANASAKFDSISYKKGASVLRCLQFLLGEDKFKSGLQKYLQTWKFNNSNTESLVQILSDTSGIKDLSTYVHNWLYEPGYPLVNVSLVANGTKINITQERYFATSNKSSNAAGQWYVPLTYTFSDNSNFEPESVQSWLNPNETVLIDVTNKTDWVVVNLQQIGFYRVNYDQELWKKLASALQKNASQIHVLNRAQLLDDVFSLAKSNYVTYSLALEFALFLEKETDYHPWYVGVKHLASLYGITGNETDNDNLLMVIHTLIEKQVEIPDDSSKKTLTPLQVLKRSLILDTACKAGHSTCVKFAETQYNKLKTNHSIVLDSNLKQTIVCTALSNSKKLQEDYDFVSGLFQNASLEYERTLFGSALTCFSDEEYINKILGDILTNTTIKSGLAQSIFTYLYSNNPKGLSIALDFVVNNATDIQKRFNGTTELGSFITSLGSKLNTDAQIDKLLKLQNSTTPDVAVKIQSTIEQVKLNRDWLAAHKTELKAALAAFNDKSSANLSVNLMFLTVLGFLVVKLF